MRLVGKLLSRAGSVPMGNGTASSPMKVRQPFQFLPHAHEIVSYI